jgi:hypothetical protein
MTTNDVARVYDTILSIPGMNETVKIDLKISRKNILLLNSIIERGTSAKATDDKTLGLIEIVPGETLQELIAVGEECLRKAGLVELNEKLVGLKGSK